MTFWLRKRQMLEMVLSKAFLEQKASNTVNILRDWILPPLKDISTKKTALYPFFDADIATLVASCQLHYGESKNGPSSCMVSTK